MTTGEVLTVFAVVLSPLIALQVSEVLTGFKDRKERRFRVYRTLMTTRGTRLAVAHVEALNMIDVEFHGTDSKSKAVLNAWKAYLDHLNTERDPSAVVWDTKRDDLFVELLYEMSRHVGYDFDKTHIRRTSYFPIGHGDLERDQLVIRKGVRAMVEGKASIPVYLVGESAGQPAPNQAPSP